MNTRHHDQAMLENADVGLPYLNYQNTRQNDCSFLSFCLKVVSLARFIEVTILTLTWREQVDRFLPSKLGEGFYELLSGHSPF